MRKQTVIAASVLLGGFALAAVVVKQQFAAPAADVVPDPVPYFDEGAGTDARIRALEVAVGEERNARQLLEEELHVVLQQLEEINANETESNEGRVAVASFDPDSPEADAQRAAFQQRRAYRSSPEARTQALIDAGFSPSRAAQIIQRESELQMQAMQARYEAQQSGEPPARGNIAFDSTAMLREELSESDYVSYLEANGRPTSVAVGAVLEASPAQAAGLQAGDRIISYAGTRVFGTGELQTQILQGAPGETVLVDIERDGIPMQVVLPRGPMGITSGRR